MRRSEFLRSTGVRFTLFYVALYLLSTIILLATLYLIEAKSLDSDIEDRIDTRIEELKYVYGLGGAAKVAEDLDTRRLSRAKLRTFYRLEENGRIITTDLPPMAVEPGRETLTVSVVNRGVPEVIEIATRTVRLGNALLTIGVEPVWHEAIDALFMRAMVGTLIAAILLGGAIGALMSRGFLSRIDAITQTVGEIMRGQLHSRVETRHTNDELDRLAASLNAMLDRIDFLMTETREVTNNVAHDLRTPLSRLRRRLEEARDAGPGSEEGANALDLAIEESAGILETFNAILGIAQIEGATSARNFTTVKLSEMLGTLSEAYGALAEEEERPFEADIPPGIEVRGDRALILQMLSNLIENAIKHTPVGTPVHMRAQRDATGVKVVIEDGGRGIPPEARRRVFDRFVRLEASRTTPGNGLGLALVAAIARLHDIQIALEDAEPGLRVVLTFPRSVQDQAEAPARAPRPVQGSIA